MPCPFNSSEISGLALSQKMLVITFPKVSMCTTMGLLTSRETGATAGIPSTCMSSPASILATSIAKISLPWKVEDTAPWGLQVISMTVSAGNRNEKTPLSGPTKI